MSRRPELSIAMVSLNPTFDFRGVPNPHKDLPIPEFALQWGKDIRRPAYLPMDYDIHIHPSAIFVLPSWPQHAPDSGAHESGESMKLIIPPPCDRCYLRNLEKYICSRGYPCSHCKSNPSGCSYSRSGYTVLHQGSGGRSLRAPKLPQVTTASAGLRENSMLQKGVSKKPQSGRRCSRSGETSGTSCSQVPPKKKTSTQSALRKKLDAKNSLIVQRRCGNPSALPAGPSQSPNISRRKTGSKERKAKPSTSQDGVSRRRPVKSLVVSSGDKSLKSKSKATFLT